MCIPVFRPKTFVGPERLGIWSILYDWAHSGSGFPLIGRGDNKYQLLDVEDLCDAIYLCATLDKTVVNDTFNIGAKDFTTMREDYQAVLDAKKELSYSGAVDVFVYAESEINAFLLSLFRRKLVLIPAGAVSQRWVATDNEVKWLIARFIGALKSKHHRINFLRVLIDSSEKLLFLNLLFYPYERATQYSGDQIGLAVTRDLSAALRMTTKFFDGKDVVDRVNLRGLLTQADEIHGSFFALLARLFSPFPHLADRYLNLLDFARSRYPAGFDEYLSHYDETTRSEILAILPNIHAPSEVPPSSAAPSRMAGAAD